MCAGAWTTTPTIGTDSSEKWNGASSIPRNRDFGFITSASGGPFLFELLQLRLDRLQLHARAVPDLLIMGPCARGLHPHPPFGVFDRAPQALAFLRELLQFQADAMVPLLFGQQLARPRFRDAREGRVESRHPGICTPPPAKDEEARRQSDQAARDVRSHDVAEARRLVHAEGAQE